MIHQEVWNTFSKYNGEKFAKKDFDEGFKTLRKENEKPKKEGVDRDIGLNWHLSTALGSEFTMAHRGVQEFYIKKEIFEEYDVDLLYQMVCIDDSMNRLRKGYVPQTGAGSQSGDFRLYRKLGKSMEKIMKNYEKYLNG